MAGLGKCTDTEPFINNGYGFGHYGHIGKCPAGDLSDMCEI